MNEHKFKVSMKNDESGEITGPDAFGTAFRLAEHWKATRKGSIKILRADNAGIKFFLYQIIR